MNKVTPIKGFRQAPAPTKGEVQKENATLVDQLTNRVNGLQQFYGNLINQVMRQNKTHEQELSAVSIWLATAATTEESKLGDSLLLDYAGVLLNEDGTDAKIILKDSSETAVEMSDYFDGGSGKLFMLNNLGGGTLIAGFEEQMVGLKANEGKEVIVQFPENYGIESLRNKKAKFTVYIHEVRRAFDTSPVGKLIDENMRVRAEIQAKLASEAKAKKAAEEPQDKEAKGGAVMDADRHDAPAPSNEEAERQASEVQTGSPEDQPTAEQVQAEAAETPQESPQVETAPEKSDNSSEAPQA